MMQPHNRKMSFTVYLSALAVADTLVLVIGKYWSLPENDNKSHTTT